MRFQEYCRRALRMPPHILILKVFQLFFRITRQRFDKAIAQLRPSYSSVRFDLRQITWGPRGPASASVTASFPLLPQIVSKLMNKEACLLGSSWVDTSYEQKPLGVEGHRYTAEVSGLLEDRLQRLPSACRKVSKNIASHISPSYIPIDWQRDFKSGYRWNENTFWTDIPYGHLPGIDIKVPWELARAQHLPQLAYAYAAAKNENSVVADVPAQEIINQILDFIAFNPPKFGVNWKCPMDVSIRAANWVAALSFLTHYGFKISDDFLNIFCASLVDHGRFVRKHLEKGVDFRGNHYLADIAGLGVLACFLPLEHEVIEWRAFAFDELQKEWDFQFQSEGSNFEGSTSYHRLSVEMLLYPFLFYSAHRSEAADGLQKIKATMYFSQAITQPNQQIVQIGDNDSGRFFKLFPQYLTREDYFKKFRFPKIKSFTPYSAYTEDLLDHGDLIRTLAVLGTAPSPSKDWVEDFFYQNKGFSLSFDAAPVPTIPAVKSINTVEVAQGLLTSGYQRQVTRIAFSKALRLSHLEKYVYSEFGLIVFKIPEDGFFLSFRCGNVGQLHRGGHDHNDQLSLTLWVDHVPLLFDPGTYLYTPLAERRNQFRSVLAHFAPHPAHSKSGVIEPAPLNQGLFSLSGSQDGELLSTDPQCIVGRAFFAGKQIYRFFTLEEDELRISDYIPKENIYQGFAAQVSASSTFFSPGYGELFEIDPHPLLLKESK